MSRRRPWVAAAALVGASLAAMGVRGADDGVKPGSAAAIEPAISRPSEEVKPTFAAAGLVAEVLVHEGDAVKAGQVVLRQDDRQEQLALDSAKLDAESTAEIRFEEADVKLKQDQLDRKRKLYALPGHPASLSEVEEAENAVQLSQAQVKVAELHHEQKGMDYKKQAVKVELMQLHSPVDGVVQKINTHAGEMSDPQRQEGVIVIAKNDPVWVEMNLAADRAQKLSIGQELKVRYKAPAGEPANPWMAAKIIYFPPHADAASGTEMVRLELANPSGQRSGLAMEVRLPDNVAAMADAGGN